MMFRDTMRNLKEYLITLVLFPIFKSQSIQVRDTSVVINGVRTTISNFRTSFGFPKIESMWKKKIEKVFKKREVASRFITIYSVKDFRFRYKLRRCFHQNLSPLQYLSGLTGYGMDRIINWLILIIIFVFDPVNFEKNDLLVDKTFYINNNLKVDKGIVDKQKVIRKRELYDEVPEEDEDEDDGMWTEEEKNMILEINSMEKMS